MRIEKVAYREGSQEFEAHVAAPDEDGPRPAVVVAHAWAGQGPAERDKAERLASLGYVGAALDVYGKGVFGSDKEENARLMQPLADDRALLLRRLQAGVDAVRQHPGVDATRVAAIGYCFGGLCVLDLARGGCDLRGVVSFHGLLQAAEDMPSPPITAKVLALHGYDDPMATPDQARTFMDEMTARNVDWQLHAYGQTMHAFTNPDANDPDFGTVYRREADQRSWMAMTDFLAEVLS